MKILIVLLIPIYGATLYAFLYKGLIHLFKIDEKSKTAYLDTISPSMTSGFITLGWTIFTIVMLFKYDYL